MVPPRTSRFGHTVFYLRDPLEANHVASRLRAQLTGPLGFDIEHKPNCTKGSSPNRTALVQLASDSIVLLVQVSAMSTFPPLIKALIENAAVVKAGVGIKRDAEKLWHDFGISAASCVELNNLARAVDPQWATVHGHLGLARLAKAYTDHDMKKSKAIVMSDWELYLTDDQLDYAADDAIAGHSILQKLYTIMPSVEPIPPAESYLFHISHGSSVTASGAWFRLTLPAPAPKPKTKIDNTRRRSKPVASRSS